MGRVSGASRDPIVRTNVISPAIVKIDPWAAEISAPDDHFVASPNCRVRVSRRGRGSRGGSCPTVIDRVIFAARVRVVECFIDPAPDNHFAPGPDCRVSDPAERDVLGAGSRPTVRARVVPAAGVQIVSAIGSTPDDHFTAGPHRCVIPPRGRRVYDAGGYPGVGGRIVSSATVQDAVGTASISTPNDHFAACPHRSVMASRQRRIGGAGVDPTVDDRIISSASVQFVRTIISAPDNHLASRPRSTMNRSSKRCVCSSRARPIVRSGVISCARV
jgi:hypothetical protein